ncbi:hypothetical protein [Parvularcula sp. LCG005]|uniref:hypothetical protein n=1 Tax=Parvularcula sp. LCG005 TaxID=3078805 RepID=UPI0029437B46|nr:hypothetical protein [Parvularcula sp. LCG005]WOI52742.1 hypothetical protein RUI03_11355 [Parvularcula sp. LCG005]
MHALWSVLLLFASIEAHAAPSWVTEAQDTHAAILMPAYRAAFPTIAPDDPVFEVTLDDSVAGQMNIAATTDVNVIRVRLTGEGWSGLTAQGDALLKQNTAHELAHVWQLARLDAVWEPRWLHEGFAELVAVDILVRSGLWSVADRDRWRDRTDGRCENAMKTGALAGRFAVGDEAAAYACGYVVLDVVAVRLGMTGAELFLAYADAVEHPEKMMQLADAVRIDTLSGLNRFVFEDLSRANGKWVIDALRAGRL